ncbi:MAG: hypothetical protein DMF56_07125 [Acidobacteria bacterium]|nr:MAG: hypothetical protein DMF56_07125 [Acidobacteriota bacterium]
MEPVNLSELFRDSRDVEDFLAAYGEEIPPKPDDARKHALTIVETVDPTHVVGVLFGFARNFARMVSEIADFCATQGAAISGQIQLPHDEVSLDLRSLQSAWAFAGSAPDVASLEARSHALAAALEDVALRLNSGDLVREETEERLTGFGRALRSSPDPVHRMISRSISGTTRDIHHELVSEADLRALELAIEAVDETSSALAAVPLSAAAATALQQVQQHLPALVEELRHKEIDPTGEASPIVLGLTDEIMLLTTQLRDLGAEMVEGERVSRGFQDFLRTEFWPARWRVYELWLLVRLLGVLKGIGGRLQLFGVDKGIWRVRYGHAEEPVARATFSAGEVDFYYQYWRDSAEGADMPDLVAAMRGGRPIAVIDPKHGRSYSRSRVQAVLTRYATQLDADLTAIVNYFPMRSYPFENVRTPMRSWILASDVAPGTNASRRLELLFEETLRGRGFHEAEEPYISSPTASQPRAVRPADLIYWATEEREVDEPAGFWRSSADATTLPVKGLAGRDNVQLDASPDGMGLLILREPDVTLLRVGQAPKRIADWTSKYFISSVGWSPDGEYFVLPLDKGIVLFDRSGDRVDGWPDGAGFMGWHPEGHSLYCLSGSGETSRTLTFFAPDRGVIWERRLTFTGNVRTSLLKGRVERGPTDDSVLLHIDYVGKYRIDGGAVEPSDEGMPLSVSPSGRHVIEEGPHSRHDRTLLRITDRRGQQLPLVRYTGPLPPFVRWSPDEARFAFIAQDRDLPARLFTVRVGERHARATSLPGQEPATFAWVSPKLRT